MKQLSDSTENGHAIGEAALSQSLSLADLGRSLWSARGYILLSVFLCELIALAHLIITPAVYPTEMLLAPQQNNSSQGSSLPGGLSGAASLLGFRAEALSSDFEKFRVIYVSPQTAGIVDGHLHILEKSFPGWNRQLRRWEMPPLSLSNAPRRFVRWIFGRPVWRAPNLDDLASALSDEITITKRDADPFLIVSSQSRTPKLTETLMLELVNAANDILRKQAQHQAAVQIDYLGKELQTVSNTEHRQVLTTLLLGQQQNLMLSRSDLPYAAQILSPPTTHFDQPKPSITLTLAIGFLIGLLLGTFIAFFREASARSRERSPRDSLEVLRGWRTWRLYFFR